MNKIFKDNKTFKILHKNWKIISQKARQDSSLRDRGTFYLKRIFCMIKSKLKAHILVKEYAKNNYKF